MKRLTIIALLAAAILGGSTGCDKETDADKTYNAYTAWRDFNDDWLLEQQARTNPDGTPYFETAVASWDPTAFVLLHFFNDRSLTADNLVPLFTSTIDTRYYLTLADDTPVDSSYTITANGPGIFRTALNEVILGWAIAYGHMHVGDSVECIIPYQQAYDNQSTGSVPPYSNLKYNMSLVDIYAYEVNPN